MIIGTITRESVLEAFKKNITADQLIEFLNKNINPEKIRLMSENTKKKSINFVFDEEKRRPLEFLRLYNKKTENNSKSDSFKRFSIPDNVIQQLKLWEKEKNLEYSSQDLLELKNLDTYIRLDWK